jgi:hypothetical protein
LSRTASTVQRRALVHVSAEALDALIPWRSTLAIATLRTADLARSCSTMNRKRLASLTKQRTRTVHPVPRRMESAALPLWRHPITWPALLQPADRRAAAHGACVAAPLEPRDLVRGLPVCNHWARTPSIANSHSNTSMGDGACGKPFTHIASHCHTHITTVTGRIWTSSKVQHRYANSLFSKETAPVSRLMLFSPSRSNG